MANTVTNGPNTIHIVFDGVTDYDAATLLEVFSMTLIPSAPNDTVTVRHDTSAGAKVFVAHSLDVKDIRVEYYKGIGKYGGKLMRPYIIGTEVSANAELIIDHA